MSLRWRLLLSIGGALLLLWTAVALWMQGSVDLHVQRTLDRRLEMAANMVIDLSRQHQASLGTGLVARQGADPVKPAGEGMFCEIASVRGEVVLSSNANIGVPGAPAPGFGLRSSHGEQWRTYTVADQGVLITTADRLSERRLLMNESRYAAAVPFLVALLGALSVLWLGITHSLRPFENLRRNLARREPGDVTLLEAGKAPPDLMPLVTTLNQTFCRMGKSFERERRFTSDAAHELRTPLTAVKVHLQVLRLCRGSEVEGTLSSLEADVARMQRMLEQLLILARVEGNGSWEPDGREGPVNAAMIATAACELDQAERIAVTVLPSALLVGALLSVPPTLTMIAVRNLVDNALKHSTGAVSLVVSSNGRFVHFCVKDQGAGLNDEEIACATERFWRQGHAAGSGLGLSIVHAIVERFGGSLSMARSLDGGFEVLLSLPCIDGASRYSQ